MPPDHAPAWVPCQIAARRIPRSLSRWRRTLAPPHHARAQRDTFRQQWGGHCGCRSARLGSSRPAESTSVPSRRDPPRGSAPAPTPRSSSPRPGAAQRRAPPPAGRRCRRPARRTPRRACRRHRPRGSVSSHPEGADCHWEGGEDRGLHRWTASIRRFRQRRSPPASAARNRPRSPVVACRSAPPCGQDRHQRRGFPRRSRTLPAQPRALPPLRGSAAYGLMLP